MESRILIGIDLSENSLKAVDYVGFMVSCHSKAEVTVLHVIKEPSPDIMPDEAERARRVEEMRADVLTHMEEVGRRLTSAGVPEKQIRLKVQVCRLPVSVAELILCEQKSEEYGTVVIGRRGLSKKEEFLFGSVSNTIVREAKNCTVWVVE